MLTVACITTNTQFLFSNGPAGARYSGLQQPRHKLNRAVPFPSLHPAAAPELAKAPALLFFVFTYVPGV